MSRIKVYNKPVNRGREDNGPIPDFVLLRVIQGYSYNFKHDKEEKEYLEVNDYKDEIWPKSSIHHIENGFPPTVYIEEKGRDELKPLVCAQTFAEIYNQLMRNCSKYEYTPYGGYVGKEDKETKTNEDIDYDFL